MKKLILFLLLPLWVMAQTSTGQEQEFDYGIKNNSTQTITTPPYLTTTGMDGTQGKIPSALIALKSDLPVSYTKVVYVNSTSPSTATIFDDVNPPVINDNLLKSDAANLYIGTDASTWVWNSSSYVTKTIPDGSNFWIYPFENDIPAGSNKNEAIVRKGDIFSDGNITAGLSLRSDNVQTNSVNVAFETANTIASFDAGKQLRSLPTDTYPSLTELSYVKGVAGSINTTYAPLSSPTFTGTPTAPTAPVGTNTTQIATTAFVVSADAGNVKLTGLQTITGKKIFSERLEQTTTALVTDAHYDGIWSDYTSDFEGYNFHGVRSGTGGGGVIGAANLSTGAGDGIVGRRRYTGDGNGATLKREESGTGDGVYAERSGTGSGNAGTFLKLGSNNGSAVYAINASSNNDSGSYFQKAGTGSGDGIYVEKATNNNGYSGNFVGGQGLKVSGNTGGIELFTSNVNLDNTSYKINNSSATKTYAFTAGKIGVSNDGFGLWNVTDNTYPIWSSENGVVNVPNLSGVGTRTVVADSSGNLLTDSTVYAPTTSPTLTGTPTAPTATAGTNTTQIATTAFVLANSGTGGKYTPTAVAGSNVTSVAITAAHTYTRVGNIVTVYGIATSTTTSSSVASKYTITLPISRATSTAIVVGSGRTIDTGTSELAPVVINSLSTTTATIGFTSTSTGSIVCRYSFQYDVTD